jgi:cation transport ATPase
LPVPGRTAAEEQEAQDAARRAEFAELRHKAIGAGVAGIIAMIVSMPLMAANAHLGMGGSGDPFMQWSMRVLDPALQRLMPWAYAVPAAGLSLALLLLTAVIMGWAGRHFYTRAWQAFTHRSADMNTLIAIGTGAAFLFSATATLAPAFFTSRGVAPDVYYEALSSSSRARSGAPKGETLSALRSSSTSTCSGAHGQTVESRRGAAETPCVPGRIPWTAGRTGERPMSRC